MSASEKSAPLNDNELRVPIVRRLGASLPILCLLMLGLPLNLSILAHGGLRLGADFPAYVAAAGALRHGQPFAGRPGLWVGYPAVIALCQAAGAGLMGVVAIQLAAAALAVAAQYQLGRDLGGHRAGLAAAALLALNPDIARWHAYILTDSLYTSAVVLAAWAIHRAAAKKGVHYLAAAGVLLAAAALRPNGWLLSPIAVNYWIAPLLPRPRTRRLAMAAVAALFVGGMLALPAVRAGIAFEDPGGYLRRGEVIAAYTAWTLPMPAAEGLASGRPSDALRYASRHPVAALLLAVSRVACELAHLRPFYSTRHNLLLLAFLPVVYLLALAGFRRTRGEPLAGLLTAILLTHLLVVAIVGADWDGRYLLFVFPLLCVFSANGLPRRLLSEEQPRDAASHTPGEGSGV